MEAVIGFIHLPPGFVPGLEQVLAEVGRLPEELGRSVAAMDELRRSVVELTEGHYRQKFKI